MAVPRGTGVSYIVAAVLAGITIFVFYTLRDYGPKSAVRRFQNDVLSDNVQDLQQVTAEPITNREVRELAVRVHQITPPGSASRIAAMDQEPGEVEVLVLYSFGMESTYVVWIVDHQQNGIWAVNARKTLQASLSSR